MAGSVYTTALVGAKPLLHMAGSACTAALAGLLPLLHMAGSAGTILPYAAAKGGGVGLQGMLQLRCHKVLRCMLTCFEHLWWRSRRCFVDKASSGEVLPSVAG